MDGPAGHSCHGLDWLVAFTAREMLTCNMQENVENALSLEICLITHRRSPSYLYNQRRCKNSSQLSAAPSGTWKKDSICATKLSRSR